MQLAYVSRLEGRLHTATGVRERQDQMLAVSTKITFVFKVKSDCTKDIPALILYLMIHEETFYRVSIKSFPDYKHLLQENYVE